MKIFKEYIKEFRYKHIQGKCRKNSDMKIFKEYTERIQI